MREAARFLVLMTTDTFIKTWPWTPVTVVERKRSRMTPMRAVKLRATAVAEAVRASKQSIEVNGPAAERSCLRHLAVASAARAPSETLGMGTPGGRMVVQCPQNLR